MPNWFQKMFGMARETAPTDVQRTEPFVEYRRTPAAGIRVNEITALNLSSVFSAVRVIAETVAGLPWHVFEVSGETSKIRTDHPLDSVLHVEPNEETNPFTFRQTLMGHTLLWGNGYSEIEHLRNGNVGALHQLEPHRVRPDRVQRTKKLIYDVANDTGTNTVLDPERMFHVKGLSYDGIVGLSPIRLARESLSMGIAMERFGASFFGNGAALSGILTHPTAISEDAKDNIRKGFERIHKNPENWLRVAVLEEGMEYNKIGVPPEEAQFLGSREFHVSEVARWFRLPPHKIGDLRRATFSNIEQQNKEFVDNSILPWVRALEQEANRKLFLRQERGKLITRTALQELLRGDAKARGDFYFRMFQMGMSLNEIRRLEGQNDIPGGDLRLVPANMVSLERAIADGGTTRQRQPRPQRNEQTS